MAEKVPAQQEEDKFYDPLCDKINVKHFGDEGATYSLLGSQELLLGIATDPPIRETMGGAKLLTANMSNGRDEERHRDGCKCQRLPIANTQVHIVIFIFLEPLNLFYALITKVL